MPFGPEAHPSSYGRRIAQSMTGDGFGHVDISPFCRLLISWPVESQSVCGLCTRNVVFDVPLAFRLANGNKNNAQGLRCERRTQMTFILLRRRKIIRSSTRTGSSAASSINHFLLSLPFSTRIIAACLPRPSWPPSIPGLGFPLATATLQPSLSVATETAI